jgi:hypothetical protein
MSSCTETGSVPRVTAWDLRAELLNETADLAGDDASSVTDFTGVFTVRGGDATTGAFLTFFRGFP